MGRFYCEYCRSYLTHDKRSVLLAHIHGKQHIKLIRDYYLNKFVETKTTSYKRKSKNSIKDKTTKDHTNRNTVLSKRAPDGVQPRLSVQDVAPNYKFQVLNKEELRLRKLNNTRRLKKLRKRRHIREVLRDAKVFGRYYNKRDGSLEDTESGNSNSTVENGLGILNHLYKYSPGYNKVFLVANRFDNPDFNSTNQPQRDSLVGKKTLLKKSRDRLYRDDVNLQAYLKNSGKETKKYNPQFLKPPPLMVNKQLKVNFGGGASTTGLTQEFMFKQNKNFYKLFMKKLLPKKEYLKMYNLKNPKMVTRKIGKRFSNRREAGATGAQILSKVIQSVSTTIPKTSYTGSSSTPISRFANTNNNTNTKPVSRFNNSNTSAGVSYSTMRSTAPRSRFNNSVQGQGQGQARGGLRGGFRGGRGGSRGGSTQGTRYSPQVNHPRGGGGGGGNFNTYPRNSSYTRYNNSSR